MELNYIKNYYEKIFRKLRVKTENDKHINIEDQKLLSIRCTMCDDNSCIDWQYDCYKEQNQL